MTDTLKQLKIDIDNQINDYEWRKIIEPAMFLALGPLVFCGVAAQDTLRDYKDSLADIRIMQLQMLLDIIWEIRAGKSVGQIKVNGWTRDTSRSLATDPYIVRGTGKKVTLGDIIEQLKGSGSKVALDLATRIRDIGNKTTEMKEITQNAPPLLIR